MKKTPPRKQPRTDATVPVISDEALALVTAGFSVPKLSAESKDNGF